MIYGIHLLRGIGAFLVAGYHLKEASRVEGYDPLLFDLFAGGSVGVDIFFVISGFIIFYIATARSGWDAGQFLIGRFFRIYPMYWIFLSLFIALSLAFWGATGDASPVPTLRDIVKSYLLVPTDTYVLNIAWTLAIEVTFYVLFALSFRPGSPPVLLLATLTVWSGAAIAFTFLEFDVPDLDVVLQPAVVELLFGVLIAMGHRRGNNGFSSLALLFGATGVGWNLLFYPTQEAIEWRFLISGVPAAALVYGALHLKPIGKAVMQPLGDASYILYLMHLPAYMALGFLVEEFFGLRIYASDVAMLVTLLMVTGLSILLHHAIERPFQAFYKGRLRAHIVAA